MYLSFFFLVSILQDGYSLLNSIDCFKDFPGDPVVKNPPSNAGDAGLIPGQGTKIPHAVG